MYVVFYLLIVVFLVIKVFYPHRKSIDIAGNYTVVTAFLIQEEVRRLGWSLTDTRTLQSDCEIHSLVQSHFSRRVPMLSLLT